MIGENEIMASQNALNYLEVSAQFKEKLEVYFDISTILSTFRAGRESVASDYDDTVDNQLTELLRSLLPDIEEFSSLLRN